MCRQKASRRELVALHERLEGAVVPAADQSDEFLVTLKPQERRASRESGQRPLHV